LVLFFKKERLPSWSLHHQEDVTSTQDLAIAAALEGAPARQAYVAARQTAGRGRQGRVWQAPQGNLYFSALLRPAGMAPVPAFWSLMAGIAVHDAIGADTAGLVLKWPNDLLLDGGKVAGVLIDSAMEASGMLDWVVIGVGVNVAHAPALPDRRTSCLAEHGISVTPAVLAEQLMAAIDHWAAQDLLTIRAAWLTRAHPLGTPLRVQRGAEVIDGLFDGLAPDGALLLRGHPPITSGEVTQEARHAAGG
jgi:BirA family biotin operon repressor/biotin-[acetyl-CoA-carboxylase] ligase